MTMKKSILAIAALALMAWGCSSDDKKHLKKINKLKKKNKNIKF